MKKNFLFIVKCILASLPLVLIVLYIKLNPMGYMDGEYPSWKYSKDVVFGKINAGTDYETLILGDSRGMADFVPSEFDVPTCNLAVGGATSIEMYYALNEYLNNHTAPREVFIIFAPFHYSYIDNYETRTMYFNYLKLSDALDMYKMGTAFKADAFERFEFFDIISMYIGMPDKYMPALINARLNGRYSENIEAYRAQQDNLGHGLFGTLEYCDELNYEANYTEMKKDGEQRLIYVYLGKLLELCKERGIRVKLLQAPMNESSYEHLNENFVSQYVAYLEKISSEHEECIIETAIPEYSNDNFGDASHLNAKGAEKFTKEIIERYN